MFTIPIAVVKKADAVIAFTNLWQGAGASEVSVDLMRFDPGATPPGVMNYLFIELML